jgi:hypothetical protein
MAERTVPWLERAVAASCRTQPFSAMAVELLYLSHDAGDKRVSGKRLPMGVAGPKVVRNVGLALVSQALKNS